MPASQTGSNDTRQEMGNEEQQTQKSLLVIHKKRMATESEAELLFSFLKSLFSIIVNNLAHTSRVNMILSVIR